MALRAVVFTSSLSVSLAGLAVCTKSDKAAKAVVCGMDHALVGLGDNWRNYTLWLQAMQPFWSKDFIYTPAYGINETVGLKNWFDGENLEWFHAFPTGIFNQMLFLGDETNASSMTYSIGIWESHLGPLQPTHRRTNIRITDFYHIANDRITHNWMMIDMLDMMRQAGRAPLELSPLPQGKDFPPRAMEGLPAPISTFVKAADTDACRRIVEGVLDVEWRRQSDDLSFWHDDMVWYGPVPFGMARSKEEYHEHFLKPLHTAFTDPELSLDTLTCEGPFCAAHGNFTGTHTGTWLGYQASGLRLQLNFGMHWHVEDGKILESWAIFDLPKMFLALGVDLLSDGINSESKSRVRDVVM